MYPNSKMNAQTRKLTRKNSNFAVYYNSMKVNGKQLSKRQTTLQPTISFNPKKGKFYTIIMYDLHAPTPMYLHFLSVNVTDPSSIVPLVQYQPPSPPLKDTHYHVYIFDLYEQSGFLTVSPPSDRSGFSPESFAKTNILRKIAQRGFYVIP